MLTCKAALLLDSGSYEDALHFVDSPAAGGRFPFEKVGWIVQQDWAKAAALLMHLLPACRLVNLQPCSLLSLDQLCSTSWRAEVHS